MKKENTNYIVFQNYFGRYQYSKKTKQITFDNFIQLYITSASPEFIQYLINNILLKDSMVNLWHQNAQIEKVEILKEPNFETECLVKTLSPITVYSTFQNQFRKKTYYYNPEEPEFFELIKQNLLKKYVAFNNKEIENENFEMKLVGKYNEKNIIYKNNFAIRAYEGKFLMKGNPKLMKLAYETGVSNKNSQGFRDDRNSRKGGE